MCYQVLQLTHASSDLQSRQPTLHSYPCCITWCGTATPEERHCRSATLPHFSCGTTTTELTVGSRGYLYPFSSSPMALLNLLLIPARPKQKRAALSLPHSLLEPLKLLPLIPFQIQENLSLQTALESSPNCPSSPRALGSGSSRWIVFVTLGACS